MTPISVLIPIADIGELEEHQYVGLISESSQAHLEARLLEEGLLSPIWVRRNGNAARHRFSVIAGRHRLRAAKTLGWVEIAAAVKAGPSSSAAELKRLQLIENLDRRVMRPIERACFIMERWNEVAHKLPECGIGSQQSEAARARWSASLTLSNARREDRGKIDVATAESTGESAATVRRYRKIFEKIVLALPDQFALLNAHDLCEKLSSVEQLAALKTVEARREAATLLLSEQDWPSMEQVLSQLPGRVSKGNRVDPRNHRAVITTTWEKMPKDEKLAFLLDDLPRKLTENMAKKLVVKLMTDFAGLRGVEP